MRKLLYISVTVILCVVTSVPCYCLNQRKVDSLESPLNTDIADSTRVNVLNDLSEKYLFNNPDTSYLIANAAYILAEQLAMNRDKKGRYKKKMINAANSMASALYLKSNYANALKHFEDALRISEEVKDAVGISRSISNIGLVHWRLGNYPKALEYYFKALVMKEEILDHAEKSRDADEIERVNSTIAIALMNIGLVYAEQGDFSIALEYCLKGLKIDEEAGNKRGIAHNLGNIGTLYDEQNDFALAREYYFKALKITEKLGHNNRIAGLLGNIGTVNARQAAFQRSSNPGNAGVVIKSDSIFNNALKYLFRAQKMYEKIGNKQSLAEILGNIGSVYKDLNNYAESERFLLQALELDKETESLVGLEYRHVALSELYEHTDRFQEAYEHYVKFSIVRDSIFNEDKSKDIGKLEAKHEFETAEMERKRTEEEQAKQEAAAKSRRDNLQYSGILIFLVMIFAGVFALGRISIPIRLAEGLIFFSFLLFFEFTLVLLDPYIEQYSSGAPAIKLGFNAMLAALIFPMHAFFESKMKKRITGTELSLPGRQAKV